MSADRFALEDKIYNAWQTSKDIESIFNNLCDGTIDQNTAENGLLGLKVIHDLRMEELWDMFTQVFQLDDYSPAQWEKIFGKPLDEEGREFE